MKTIVKILLILLSSTSIKATVNTNETNVPSGLVFRIEITLTDKILSEVYHKNFAPVNGKNELKQVVLVGAWCDYLLAQKAKSELKEAGYLQTEIKSFFNNYEITLSDAFELINNRNYTEINKTSDITKQEIEMLLEQVGEKMIYYRLQIGVYDGINADAFLSLPAKYKLKISEFGVQSYVCGKFFGYNEANDMVKILHEEGLTDVTIIAFNGENQQLPLERAQEVEQKLINEKLNELAKQ